MSQQNHAAENVTEHATNAAEQLFPEQARAYYRDMKSVADNTSDGHVLRLAETFAVGGGD
jgi:hypothetical protein